MDKSLGCRVSDTRTFDLSEPRVSGHMEDISERFLQ